MKLNFNQPILDFKGKEFSDKATLAQVVISALMVPEQGEDGSAKFKKFQLAQTFDQSTDETEFKTEDLAIIKESVGKHHNPLVVGRVYQFIEKA